MAEDLRVLIATAGRPDLLQRTLESLAACEKPDIYRETVIVENGPRMGLDRIVAGVDPGLRARYMHVDCANKSNALNVAIAELQDECLVFFTDDDVRLSSNVLTAYADATREIQGGMFLGGATDVDYDEHPPQWLLPFLPADAREFTRREFETGSRYMVFLGYNWAAFVRDLREAGGFDCRFGPGGTSGSIGQESDMQQRLLKMGTKPVFLPEARVWHYVPPQRCSPDWVIQRGYRYGILDAIQSHPAPKNVSGIPWWYLRRLGRTWMRYHAARLSGDRLKAFRAKEDLYYQKGVVKGLMSLRKTNPAR